jgi:hypothetical protein
MVDLMFAKFYEATILTFRIFRWTFRLIALMASVVLNRRENQPFRPEADLFEPKQRRK